MSSSMSRSNSPQRPLIHINRQVPPEILRDPEPEGIENPIFTLENVDFNIRQAARPGSMVSIRHGEGEKEEGLPQLEEASGEPSNLKQQGAMGKS